VPGSRLVGGTLPACAARVLGPARAGCPAIDMSREQRDEPGHDSEAVQSKNRGRDPQPMSLLNRLGAALSSDFDPVALREEMTRLEQRLSAQQAAAAEREQLLQTVLDATPVAIVLLDDVGTIVFTNAGARELFFESKNHEGENFLRMLAGVPEPLRKALLSESDHIFSFGSHGESETYHLAKRHLSLGEQPHSVLIVRNMTLELSQKENQVLRKAIRVIHHEFANSLAPVISLLQSARSKIGKPEALPKLEQMLSVIEGRVSHLNVFLSGFAALGKLPRPRNQEQRWDSFLDALRPLLPDITIAAAPSGSGWFDPAQVQQIIINLVKNAREAGSPPAEIVLEVSAVTEGGYRTSVLDRGQGMTDEALEHAMVPSFTTKATGSGMGLTLCREIVDAHHGRLRISRREGGGIGVSFWLPAREASSSAASVSRARLSLSRT
jgi:two-component system, NtrC family, nitrogen regulation sensor histidine kinase NtrY